MVQISSDMVNGCYRISRFHTTLLCFPFFFPLLSFAFKLCFTENIDSDFVTDLFDP
jgi:hypothetical protein